MGNSFRGASLFDFLFVYESLKRVSDKARKTDFAKLPGFEAELCKTK